jgi:uncharacterized protein YoxC
LKHSDHALKHLNHDLKHLIHALKQLNHALKHFIHALKNLIHAFKHLNHALKYLIHALKHLNHALEHLIHALKHSIHDLEHSNHAIKHFIHALKHLIHALKHLNHALKHSIHALKHLNHALRHLIHAFTHLIHALKHLIHPPLVCFVTVIAACCSDDETNVEAPNLAGTSNANQGSKTKPKGCVVLCLPWQHVQLERIMIALDQLKAKNREYSVTKPNTPPPRVGRRLAQPKDSLLPYPKGLPITFYDEEWLKSLSTYELQALDAKVDGP